MTDFTLSPDVGAEVSLFPWIIDSLVVYIFEVDAPQYASFIGKNSTEKLYLELSCLGDNRLKVIKLPYVSLQLKLNLNCFNESSHLE